MTDAELIEPPNNSAVRDYSISKVIVASAVGTMIEWYDFYIFGSLATVISPLFTITLIRDVLDSSHKDRFSAVSYGVKSS